MKRDIGEFGKVFKLLRLKSGLRQRDLDGTGLTMQTVSRFENQHSDLVVHNVLDLLSEVPLTLHEYLTTSPQGYPTNFDGFVHFAGGLTIPVADNAALSKLALTYRSNFARTGRLAWRLRATMIEKTDDVQLGKQERRSVYEYLLNVHEWSAYEFILLRRTLDTGVLLLSDASGLWQKMRRFRQEDVRSTFATQHRQMQTLLVVAQMYLNAGDYDRVQEVLSVVRRLPARVGDIDHDFTIRTIEAEYLLRAPGRDWHAGRDLLHELIFSAKYLDAPQVAERLLAISDANGTNFRKVRQNA